jgi:pyrroloquinoline quinone biosynthesis protein D
LSIEGASRPRLPRGVRLRHDATRNAWMLLAPERVVVPDETAVEVLRLCDGERTVEAIVAELARAFEADPAEVEADVLAFLAELAAQRMIES